MSGTAAPTPVALCRVCGRWHAQNTTGCPTNSVPPVANPMVILSLRFPGDVNEIGVGELCAPLDDDIERTAHRLIRQLLQAARRDARVTTA